jgi:hypothetical protein
MDIIIMVVIIINVLSNLASIALGMLALHLFGEINYSFDINLSEMEVEDKDWTIIPCLEWDGVNGNTTIYYQYLVSTGGFALCSAHRGVGGMNTGIEASPRMWVYGFYEVCPCLKLETVKVGTINEIGRIFYSHHMVEEVIADDSYGSMKSDKRRYNPKKAVSHFAYERHAQTNKSWKDYKRTAQWA